MTVAVATKDDLDAIVALEESFPEARWSEASWVEELGSDHGLTLVARDADDAVMGVCTFSCVADVADLNRVVVAPGHRRAGLGRRLVLAGLEWAAQRGAQQVMLEVEATNEPAITLYEQVGFVPLARRANYYGPGHDAVVMALRLGE